MKLKSKILLLVAGPLIFQILILGILAYLLHQAEKDLQMQIHVAELNALADNLHSKVGSSFAYGILYGTTHDQFFKKKMDSILVDLNITRKQLIQQLTTDKYDGDSIQRLDSAVKNVINTGQQICIDDPTGRSKDERVLFTLQSAKRSEDLNNQINQIVLFSHRLSPNSDVSADSRRKVVVFLYAAVVADLLTAFLLGLITIKNIVHRVKVVNQNANKLALGHKLLPHVGGLDEIAELDHSFRSMASSLADSNSKNLALIDNTADILCSIASDGKFVSVSQAVERVWGFEPDELIGHRAINFVVDSDRPAMIDSVNEAMKSKLPAAFENEIIKADGQVAKMSWSAIWSLKDSSLFCVIRDVSREAELARMKQAVMDTVAHDLRAPLTAIIATLNNLSLGVLGPMSEEAKSRIVRAEKQASRLIRLVSDLLDHERLSAGKMAYSKKPVKVKELLEEAVQSLAPLADEKTLRITIDGDDKSLNLDKDRILQVFINILANAVFYSPPGSGIEVDITKLSKHVEIKFIDHGPGIKDVDKPQVFERFKQTTGSRTSANSGLGLAISRMIVENHQGSMGVSDTANGGSTFWIRFSAESSDYS